MQQIARMLPTKQVIYLQLKKNFSGTPCFPEGIEERGPENIFKNWMY